jgi:tetraacyldisaccharide 4'-kinase
MMRTPAWWQSRGLRSTVLLPFAALYGLGFRLDRALKKPQRAPLPVIGIGNVTAGGAGKTPTTIALAHWLRAQGHTPHILTRGYGGKPQHAHRVSAQNSAAEVGDEALLLAAAAPTWVGRDRLASARAAQQAGATILLADDAMQHHALHKDLQLLVIDGARGFGNGRLLPAGPLRQPPAAAAGAVPLIIGAGEVPGITGALRARIAPMGDTAFLREGRWLAFSGIAYPQKFYTTLREAGAELAATLDFPDHHPFTAAELDRLQRSASANGLQLITTEKDWMRLPIAKRAGVRYLPIALQFHDADALARALAPVLGT